MYWKEGFLSDTNVYTGGFSFSIATKPNSAMANYIQQFTPFHTRSVFIIAFSTVVLPVIYLLNLFILSKKFSEFL
jgi:hypothetical protein